MIAPLRDIPETNGESKEPPAKRVHTSSPQMSERVNNGTGGNALECQRVCVPPPFDHFTTILMMNCGSVSHTCLILAKVKRSIGSNEQQNCIQKDDWSVGYNPGVPRTWASTFCTRRSIPASFAACGLATMVPSSPQAATEALRYSMSKRVPR